MNLEEAIKQIKEIRDESEFFSEQSNTRNYYLAKIYAIDTVLAEIDRLKVKNEQLNNLLVNQWFIGEPKEMTLREGLELIQKECEKHEVHSSCEFRRFCINSNPSLNVISLGSPINH